MAEYNNLEMKVKRIQKERNYVTKYSKDSLLEVLKEIPFDKINVPLHSYRNLLIDENRKGTQVVGFVAGYNADTDEFDIVVHEKFVDTIAEFKDIVIYPRVQVIGDKVIKILGLDICPKLYYMNMRQ